MIDLLFIEYLLLFFVTSVVVLWFIDARFNIPLLSLSVRWMRWLFFATAFAYFLKHFGWSFRPDWVHFVSGLAVWFVVETGYNWIAITALSKSDVSLFPCFFINTDGDDWPAEERSIKVKDWLREEKFERIGSFKANIVSTVYLRSIVYQSIDKSTRIQILFVPSRYGRFKSYYTIRTRTHEGKFIVTDNLFLPYGGYYPNTWIISRKTLVSSLKRLFMYHEKCLKNLNITPVKIGSGALEDINKQQHNLEVLNIKNGFLVPLTKQREEGKITLDGRYRLWKEMWFLAYFAKTVKNN